MTIIPLDCEVTLSDTYGEGTDIGFDFVANLFVDDYKLINFEAVAGNTMAGCIYPICSAGGLSYDYEAQTASQSFYVFTTEKNRIYIRVLLVYHRESDNSYYITNYSPFFHNWIGDQTGSDVEVVLPEPLTSSEVQANYVNSFISDEEKRAQTDALYFQHLSLLNGGG